MWLLVGVVNMWSVPLPTVYFLNTFQPQAANVKVYRRSWKIRSIMSNNQLDHWLDQPSPNGGHKILHSKHGRKRSHAICFLFPLKMLISWWRHQMETFSALLAICAGNSPVPGEFPAQRPVTQSFNVCFDLRLNKRLSKQSWGWWFETLSRQLWRHSNVQAKCFSCSLWW